MMVTAVLFTIGALIQGFAHDHTPFVIARLMGGMAVGAASVLSPAYISEVAPASVRGRLTTLQQIMIIIGLTIAFVVNYFLAQSAGRIDGRVLGRDRGMALDVPDAGGPGGDLPRRAHLHPGKSALPRLKRPRRESLAGPGQPLWERSRARKLDEIRATYAEDHRPRLSDIKGNGLFGIRPIVWAGIMLAVFQQLVGINVIFYYGETLWKLAGVSEEAALQRNILSGVVSIAACIVTIMVIDKIGRNRFCSSGRPEWRCRCSRWPMRSTAARSTPRASSS